MTTLTFITGNQAKAAQLKQYLSFPVSHARLDIPEIQSLDLATVASDKATRAYAKLGTPVLVEDTALTFAALGDLPGPFIKWFLTSLGNEGLTNLLANYTNRAAVAETCFALCDTDGAHCFFGDAKGIIAKTPRGEQGFGWDPIFIPQGYEQTWAQMDGTLQRETSMRRGALAKLQTYLEENYR